MFELILDVLVTLLSVAVVGQYIWALRGHFSSETVPPGTRLISVAVLATSFIYLFMLWYQSQPIWALVTGFVIEALSLALFWAAIVASRDARLGLAFNKDKPDGIVTSGPYNHIRHPFYTSYLIFWAGWAVATWSWISVIPFIALTVIYVVAARGEEQKFLASDLAGNYAAYQKRTGFFWPRLIG